jgi:hypothetical protein
MLSVLTTFVSARRMITLAVFVVVFKEFSFRFALNDIMDDNLTWFPFEPIFHIVKGLAEGSGVKKET